MLTDKEIFENANKAYDKFLKERKTEENSGLDCGFHV